MKNRLQSTWIGLLIGGIIVISLAVAGWALATSSTADEAFFEARQIIYLENLLQGNLEEETRKNIERKLEIARRSATAYVESRNNPAFKEDLSTANLPENRQPPFPTGIFEGGELLVRPEKALIENRWQENLNGTHITVLAGSPEGNPQAGIIYVLTTIPALRYSKLDRYLATDKNGSLKIVSAEGARLTLKAANGKILYFDALGHQYVANLTVKVPTVTPPAAPQENQFSTAPYPGPVPGTQEDAVYPPP